MICDVIMCVCVICESVRVWVRGGWVRYLSGGVWGRWEVCRGVLGVWDLYESGRRVRGWRGNEWRGCHVGEWWVHALIFSVWRWVRYVKVRAWWLSKVWSGAWMRCMSGCIGCERAIWEWRAGSWMTWEWTSGCHVGEWWVRALIFIECLGMSQVYEGTWWLSKVCGSVWDGWDVCRGALGVGELYENGRWVRGWRGSEWMGVMWVSCECAH